VTVLEKLKKFRLLFHTGLVLFSLAPAVILLLLLIVLNASAITAVAAALFIIIGFQTYGLLYSGGATAGPLPLKLSFWTLKTLQSAGVISLHVPETMVVAMNNKKALSGSSGKYSPDKTLILIPHCLQNHECPRRLTFNPDACIRCGKCPIGMILDLRDRFGTRFAIASGGTSARKIVEDTKPSLILAVACPVDLSLGILDVHPVTVVGVLNEWRNGPCFDTWVDTSELEAVLELFLT
jgi:uncharacterized protein